MYFIHYKHCYIRIVSFFKLSIQIMFKMVSCAINECFVIMTFKEMNANTKKQVPMLILKITTGLRMDNII